MGGQVAYRGAVAAYTIVLAGVLTQAEYGNYALAIAVVAVTAAVADGGVSWLLTREITLESASPGVLVRRLLSIRLRWAGAVCFGCGSLGAALSVWSQEDLALVGVVFIASFAESTAAGFEAASLGSERPRRNALAQTLAAATIAGGAAMMLLTQGSVVTAVAVLAASSAIRGGVLAAIWRSELRGGQVRPDVVSSRDVLSRSMPFLALTALGAVYFRADIVLLHTIVGATETAEYAAAFRFVDLAIVFGGVIAALMVPRMTRAWRDDPCQIIFIWRRAVGVVLALTLPAVVLAVLFSQELVTVLFGERYRSNSGYMLQLLAPTITLTLLASINSAALFASGRTGSIVLLTALYVGVTVVMTWAMVVAWGGPGAAAATTGSAAFTFAYLAVIVHRWSRRAPLAT
jgi:PST family polysaccharide transporter